MYMQSQRIRCFVFLLYVQCTNNVCTLYELCICTPMQVCTGVVLMCEPFLFLSVHSEKEAAR
jgi:hypothetical protein